MSPRDQKTGYDPLNETDVPPAEGDFSLEEILAEYGGGREKILKEVEEIVFQADQKEERPEVKEIREPLFHRPPEPPAPPKAAPIPSSSAPTPAEPAEEEALPAEDAAPEEAPSAEAPPKAEEDPEGVEALDLTALFQEDLPEAPHPISLEEVVSDTVDSVMEEKSERGAIFQTLMLLTCLQAVSLLTWQVFARAGRMLLRGRCSWETLMAVSALAAAGDCVSRLVLPERSPVMPYAAIAGLGLVMAQWGAVRESRGLRDLFRTAAVDSDPPYLVTETERGACKQNGTVRGFYTAVVKDDAATLLQSALLPVVLGLRQGVRELSLFPVL